MHRGLRDLIRRMSREHPKWGATGGPSEGHVTGIWTSTDFWRELCALEPGGQQMPTRSGAGDEAATNVNQLIDIPFGEN
jgi:hypothetical protein